MTLFLWPLVGSVGGILLVTACLGVGVWQGRKASAVPPLVATPPGGAVTPAQGGVA